MRGRAIPANHRDRRGRRPRRQASGGLAVWIAKRTSCQAALLPMPGNIPVLRHVVTELESRTDRETDGIAAVLQKIGKQMIVYQVGLHNQAEMFGDVDGHSASDSVERGPFFLFAGRRDGLHYQLGHMVERMRGGD